VILNSLMTVGSDMPKIYINDKPVRTDILDEVQKQSVVDFISRKFPTALPRGIDLNFDSSGGLIVSYDDKTWYVGAKINSDVPQHAKSCDSIEEALYLCINSWNDQNGHNTKMHDVLAERALVRKMQGRGYLPSVERNIIKRKSKFYNVEVDNISLTSKPSTNKPHKP
jgi:hypothetical protein